MKRLVSMLLLIVTLLALTVPSAFAAGEVATIYFTNDVHTYIDQTIGYATVASMKKNTPGSILVDAGDHVQGTAYGGMDDGETIIKIMNAAGYDLATLGNHEFDYGRERAFEIIDEANFDYVSCNYMDLKTGKTVLASYKVIESNGIKIAFVGVTTPEAITKSTPAYFQDDKGNWIYGILEKEEMYAAFQNAIDEASKEADFVVGLGHLGIDPSSEGNTSVDLIGHVSGLSAFIDGHSHNEVNKAVEDKNGKYVILAQTGNYFNKVGKLEITKDGLTSCQLINADNVSAYTPDPAVQKMVDDWKAAINEMLGTKIAESDIDFTINFVNEEDLIGKKKVGDRAVRLTNTNLFDLSADAYYYYINEVAGIDCDVTVMNGGGVRANIAAGDWTYMDAKTVHPFGNVLCVMEVPGQVILDALEFGSRLTPSVESGGFLNAAGLIYTIDTRIESTVQVDSNNIWQGPPTGDYRVSNVKVYNKKTDRYEDLDVNKTYTLGGINYTLRQMGDGFNMFTEKNGMKLVLEGINEDYLALSAYIAAFTDTDNNGYGNIATANSPLLVDKVVGKNYLVNYENPAGAKRITIIESDEDVPWDGKIKIGGLTLNVWFSKYGNTYCDCTVDHFLGSEDNGLGFSVGDIVTLKFLDKEIDLPVVNNYSDVDQGSPCIKIGTNAFVEMAINMGNFATTYELAHITKVDGNYEITAWEGVEYPVYLTFELKEAGGYLDEMEIRNLVRTNNREDYDDLTDEEYANFREVETTGMGDNKLYRGSSPINPELGRNELVDAALEKAGCTVILNLADNEETAKAYPGFDETYYSKQNVKYLNLGVDFASDEFKKGLAEGLKFFADPKFENAAFFVHCTEGKDRAGFVSALLEALMGASEEEVINDYLKTYENYYNVVDGEHVALSDEAKAKIAASNIVKTLETAFGVDDLSKADLAECAEKYLAGLGLTKEEIAQLKINLGAKRVPDTDDSTVIVMWSVIMMASLACTVVMRKKREEF